MALIYKIRDYRIRDLFKPNIKKLKAKRNTEKLANLMRFHKDPNIRMSAFEAIKEIGETSSVKYLVDATECPYCRWPIASYLVSIGAPAIEPLIEARNSENIYVKRMVYNTLVRMGIIIKTDSNCKVRGS